jgi:parallel beta-helix repeat protein
MMRRTILLTVAFILVSLPAHAAVFNVPVPYPTIQKAVDAASAGDTVLVAAGTYSDCTHHPPKEPGSGLACVVMKAGVTLLGSGSGVTTINAQYNGMGIYCREITGVVIEGLKIINCIDKNWADYGPAVYVWQSTVTVQDCVIGPNADGGLNARETSDVTVTDCTFEKNDAKSGGGLHVEESTALIENCEISGNGAPIGGGIYLRIATATIDGCTITTNNTAGGVGNGGGILAENSTPTVLDCTISGNTASTNGGGICFIECAGEITSCTIRDNEVTGDFGQGGGICFLQFSTTTVGSCTIVRNSTTGDDSDGGGMFCRASDVTITNCTVAHNEIAPPFKGGGVGGGIACFGSDPIIEKTIVAFSTVGAGVACLNTDADPFISCCDVVGNAGGDALCGDNVGSDNFAADPLFCDTLSYDYNLQNSSPCAPGNHPTGPATCGGELIGANPVACYGAVEDEGVRITRNPLISTTPNPFNQSTTIVFGLADPARVTLRVYDVTGREVASLKDRLMSVGTHRVTWDGTTATGDRVSSGIYFYRLTVGDRSHTGRMVMVN